MKLFMVCVLLVDLLLEYVSEKIHVMLGAFLDGAASGFLPVGVSGASPCGKGASASTKACVKVESSFAGIGMFWSSGAS